MLGLSNGDDLAKRLLRTDSQCQLLRAQQDGVIPMAIGVGVCSAVTWTFLKRSDYVIFTHQAMLAAVALLNIATLIIMIVDLRVITSSPGLGDLFTRDTAYIYSTYLIFSLIAVISQAYFGIRAWRLWRWKWYIAVPIGFLSAASFILRFVYTVWSYTGPQLLSDTHGEELVRAAAWYSRFIEARQGLQVASGVAGLACDVLINGLIITRLLSMKTAKGSSSLVDKFLFLTMESMLPPMLTALSYIIVRLCPTWKSSCSIGAGTWFRHMGSLQSLTYWFAMLQVLRTQNSFNAKLRADSAVPCSTQPQTERLESSDSTKESDETHEASGLPRMPYAEESRASRRVDEHSVQAV